MKTATFKDWTLTTLDDAFGLQEIWECKLLKNWENDANDITISELDEQIIVRLQTPLLKGGRSWNEVELENKFISPLIMLSEIDDDDIGYFLERSLKGVVGDYELSGIVDGMIATGVRDPKKPLFCMQEFKRSMDNAGRADAQVLAAMLVARELNNTQKPTYGMFIIGLTWNFIVLEGNQYCISKNYDCSTERVFDIFKMLKELKRIIKVELL